MEFRILGPLEVVGTGGAVVLRGRMVRRLLAMLLLHPSAVVSTDRLIDALWAGNPPSTGASTLHVYVSHLRKALGAGVVQTRLPGYLLAVGVDQIDSRRFERLLIEGQARAGTDPALALRMLSEALDLWRGQALADFAFDDFARGEIARLEELRLVAVEERVDVALALGRHHEQIGVLRAIVRDHPLRERLWGQLILALYRAGQQAEALRTFAEVRRLLCEEMGIDPSPALRRLEAAVLAQSPDLNLRESSPDVSGSRAPTNLPRARSSLIGRDDELGDVAALVSGGEIVTVVGSGGAGKTRLAIKVARRMRRPFPDGVWLVELAPLTNAELVVPAVAAAIGVREEPGEPLLDTLIASIRDRHLLVILDNCEHVVAAAACLCHSLLTASATVAILATSREALRVEGERVWRIPPLEVPDRDDLPVEAVARLGAVRLFCERARAEGDFVLRPGNAAAVAQLARRLDGIPLALELAAATTATREPIEILGELSRRFDLLVGGYRSAPARQQTLRATMQWGYDLLGHTEQALFRRLAVFAGSFTEEAVATVAPDEVGMTAVGGVLGSLVHRSMVEATVHDGRRRYRLLDTLRAFAQDRLEAAGEAATSCGQHFEWVAGLVGHFEAACDGPHEATWVARLAAENDNLRQALAWGLAAQPDRALQVAARLGNFWARVGELTEGRQWLGAALAAAPDAPVADLALALRRAGVLALLQDDQAGAVTLLHQAASAYDRAGDTAGMGHVLGFLGVVAFEQGDLAGARHILEEALVVLRGLGDERGVARGQARLGTLAAVQGDFERSLPLLEEAVRAHARAGDQGRLAASLLNLGFALLLTGALDEARPRLEQALALRRARGVKPDLAQALLALGELELAEGHPASAGERFEEALALAAAVGTSHIEAEARLGLATAALDLDDVASAEGQLTEATRLSKGRGLLRPVLFERMAEVAIARGQAERGASLLGAAAATRKTMGAPMPPVARPRHERAITTLRDQLDEAGLTQAWAAGEAGGGGPGLAPLRSP